MKRQLERFVFPIKKNQIAKLDKKYKIQMKFSKHFINRVDTVIKDCLS